DGLSDARYPVFDKDGKYLYFSASTDSGGSLEPDIAAFSRPNTRSIYLIVLDKTLPSPFAPESDEEKTVDEKPATAAEPEAQTPPPSPFALKSDKKKTVEKNPPPAAEREAKTPNPAGAPNPVAVKIDFENILQRFVSVPMPARRYTNLQTGKAGVLLATEAP